MRYLLLQIRNADDPMRANEVAAFARALGCPTGQIGVLDGLTQAITPQRLHEADVVLVGGAGNYSALSQGQWIERTLDGLRLIYDLRVPLFASCWGFQALARALGGRVIKDRSRAELGTFPLRLTETGRLDPLFGHLPETFLAHMGHEDCVVELPPSAVLLATTDRNRCQAYAFPGRPVYATQFHPELRAEDLYLRVRQYPDYLRLVTGMTLEAFVEATRDTPEANALLSRFITLLAAGHWTMDRAAG